MSIPLDVAPNATTKKPGDFRRRGVDGPPYVPSLTKTRQPQGNKADLLAQCEARSIDVPAKATIAVLKELLGTEPADDLYGRPSGFGEPLENSYALRKHIERGIGAGVIKLVLDGLDPAAVDLEDPDALDRLVLDAQDAVESMIWADRGTHVHQLVERYEKDQGCADLWPIGEALGLSTALQLAVVRGWLAFRHNLAITSIRCELPVVNDDLRIAGTLDLLDLCGRPLDTEFGRIEAGQAVIGDIKTGDARDKFAVQIAGYQGGVPFDTETEQRGEWPVRPISDIGLIYHMSMKAVLDGAPVEWQAIPVDLAAGRDGARICVEARDWPTRPVFGVPIAATSESAPMTQPAAVEPEDDAPPPAPAVIDLAPTPCVVCGRKTTQRNANGEPTCSTACRAEANSPLITNSSNTKSDQQSVVTRAALKARVARIEANAKDLGWHAEFTAQWRSFGITKESTDAEILAALDAIEPPFDPDPQPEVEGTQTAEHQVEPIVNNGDPVPCRSCSGTGAVVRYPVDGEKDMVEIPCDLCTDDPVTQQDIDVLVASIRSSDAKATVNAWLVQSRDAGCPWDVRHAPYERQYQITRAALRLAETSVDDDFARMVIALVMDDVSAVQPAFVVGETLAVLTITEARRLADLCIQIATVDGAPTPADVAACLAAA